MLNIQEWSTISGKSSPESSQFIAVAKASQPFSLTTIDSILYEMQINFGKLRDVLWSYANGSGISSDSYADLGDCFAFSAEKIELENGQAL